MVDELVLTIFLMAPGWPAGNRGAFPRRAKNRSLSIAVLHKNSRLFLKKLSAGMKTFPPRSLPCGNAPEKQGAEKP